MSKTKKLVILSVISVLLSFTFSIHSFASMNLKVNVNQPRADEYSGYIEYFVNENGNMFPRVTFWHFARGTSTDPECMPEVRVTVSNHRIVLEAVIFDADPQQTHLYNWVIGSVNGELAGSGSSYSSYSCENTAAINAYWNENGQIMGYKIYGNGVDWASTLPSGSGTYNWSVMYSETSTLYDAIMSIAESSIGSSGSITQNATDNANKIQQNQNENTDKITSNNNSNTDKITQNEDKNTDKIINNQNQLQQQEKDETQNQGQDSIDDVSGVIEDKSAGFVSSIQNLVSAMSYDGTECAWKVPSIKLPAIAGIMDEVKLTDEMPIDFEYWVNKIPPNILLLVRSLLTIGLIGYCFKELYNTISYVLTLKGGGNNE